jgi:bla regulator protein BlaR1
MAFEVASVKPATVFRPPNFPLNAGNAHVPGGRFSATFPVGAYISFAYKLSIDENHRIAGDHLPKWFSADLFGIEARAEGNPTKDQMRLMMQSLLADRFKLAIHFETREGPVFALTLVKPGKTGPKLRPHAEGPPCPDSFVGLEPGAAASVSDVFPPSCGTDQMRGRNGVLLVGSRDTTPQSLADVIYGYGFLAGEVDKPVVDSTGLTRKFDFTIEYTRGDNSVPRPPGPPNADAAPSDSQGTPFLNAMRDQLGLKLVPSKGRIRVLVIDHIERPSEN